jgi:peptidoglycan/LPS O-acetylase OafA/YrhL
LSLKRGLYVVEAFFDAAGKSLQMTECGSNSCVSAMSQGKQINTGAGRIHLPVWTPNCNELSFADYQTSTFRSGFDGLRAIGFLLVVTAHVPAVWPFAYLQGWTAVWVFFAISGYLVTMLLIREERSSGAIAYGPFLIRRFFRIVPSYAATLFLYWIVLAWLPPLAADYAVFRQELPYHLTMTTEFIDSPVFSIFIHAWAVGVETKFYLLFPPLMFLLIRSSSWRFAATLMAAVVLTAMAPLLSAQNSFVANAWCAILAGTLLAQILEWPRGFALVAALTRVPVAVPLGLVIALFVMLRYVEVLPAVTAVAVYLVAHVMLRDSSMRRLLGFGPLAYLGKRSYGAYLLHVLPIHLGYLLFGSTTVTAGLLTTVFALAVTIPAAELLYRLVEQPGMTLARRLS